jgi:Na+-transporting NADH:ubiquinone oxidoreductase subunit NqrC
MASIRTTLNPPTEERAMRISILFLSLIIGVVLGGGVVTFCNTQDRIYHLEKKVDMFQKIWDNVPEEYRHVVAP